VPEEEIDAVKQEARNIIARQGRHDPDKEKNWARVEVRAPYDGTIVEKNVTLGRMVDPAFDLYKIANLQTMAVYVHAYEEDMRTLQQLRDKLAPRRVPWEVRLTADPRGQVLRMGDAYGAVRPRGEPLQSGPGGGASPRGLRQMILGHRHSVCHRCDGQTQ
jgi:hypothetical protein